MKPVIRKVKWRKPSVGWLLSQDREEGQLFRALNNTACCIVLCWKGRGERGGGWNSSQQWGWALAGDPPSFFFGLILFSSLVLSFSTAHPEPVLERSLRRAILGGKSSLLSLKKGVNSLVPHLSLSLRHEALHFSLPFCLRIKWQFQRL